jgi:hypothetical protein
MNKIKAQLGWNTGRLYVAAGQQVSAHKTEDGRVLFYDHSRMIFGKITVEVPFTPRAIQGAYDKNQYQYDGEASWIDAGEFPMERM